MNLSAGILGFGSRARFPGLLADLDRNPGINQILLLWNGAPGDANERLQAWGRQFGKLRFRTSSANLGSAGGYSSLMQWFGDEDKGEYLWLLDDDSIPEPECADRLLAAARRADFDASRDLLMAYRADLPEFPALLLPGHASVEPHAGLCVGVHLLNLVHRPRANTTDASGHILLSSAPYGGLLIPRQAMPRLGLPDQELFLYGDDTALTLRFTRAGGTIRLCPDAIVHDSEPVWNAVGGNVGNMVRRIVHLDDRKAYYETRNRCYLGLVFYPGNPLVYWLNRAAFLANSLWLAIRHSRLPRFRLIHGALRDGERMACEHAKQGRGA